MPHRDLTSFPTMKEIIAMKPESLARMPGTVLHDALLGHYAVGTVMGTVTASKKLRRVTRAPVKATTAFSNVSASGGSVVGANKIYNVGDVLVKASDSSAIGTILTVTADAIVLTGNAAQNVAAGVDIMVSDGSGVAVGILFNDTDATGEDKLAALIIRGYLKEDQLVGLTAQGKTELGAVSMANNILKL